MGLANWSFMSPAKRFPHLAINCPKWYERSTPYSIGVLCRRPFIQLGVYLQLGIENPYTYLVFGVYGKGYINLFNHVMLEPRVDGL